MEEGQIGGKDMNNGEVRKRILHRVPRKEINHW